MTPATHREFDNPRWETNRMERAERMEIREAMRLVDEGRIESYSKPGRWRVFLQNGRAFLETFGEKK